MKDALRLIDRHGGKIWLFASLGEGFLTILWVVGLLVVWWIVNPPAEMIHKVFHAVYFPDHPEKLLDQIRTVILGASPKVMVSLATMVGLIVISILFSVMGMTGLIRQAALEDRLSIGDFFSFGLRYLFRGLGLFFILSGTALLFGWLFFRLESIVDSGPLSRITLWGMGGIIGLYVLAFFSFTPVAMLVEQTGVFQALGRVFRLFLKWPARPVCLLLVALVSVSSGVVLLGFISAFPWMILQFFQNEAVAGMVGTFFGLFMILTFHAFPVTHYMGTMILAYVEMRERLDPREKDREGEPLSPHRRVIWTRV